MKTRKFIIILSAILIVSACGREDNGLNTIANEPEIQPAILPYSGVDQSLWEYFNRFELEAKAQGIQLDLRKLKITGRIAELSGENVAGQCTFSSLVPNHVVIDRTFWSKATDLSKEFVVFHELGHCSLGRDHREDAFSNGLCKSIMRSGVDGCRDNYRAATRLSYLIELFDSTFFNEIEQP